MNGQRYYTFRPARDVRFFAIDSNYLDKAQLEWFETELRNSGEKWKICFFHHPLYSSGRKHGPSLELRRVLEPLLSEYGVNVVFAGHEHFYERVKPQNGIRYFISGGSGKLREQGIKEAEDLEKGFDRDLSFMLIEITGDILYFETISRTGDIIDSGKFPHGNPSCQSGRAPQRGLKYQFEPKLEARGLAADRMRPNVGDPRKMSGRSKFARVEHVERLGAELQPYALPSARPPAAGSCCNP